MGLSFEQTEFKEDWEYKIIIDEGAILDNNSVAFPGIKEGDWTFNVIGPGTAPVADFSATPTSGTAPLSVSFTDQSTNDPTSWLWNFGDGNTSIQANPGHTYSDAGTYTIELTTNNSFGSDTKTEINFITVFNSSMGTPCPGTPTVSDYDGNEYNTVQIDTQCWMKENLNTTHDATGNSITRYCYDNDNNNCDTYGGLYDWDTMMDGSASSSTVPSGVQGICPENWHIPSDEEWKILEGAVDSQFGYPDSEWDETNNRGYDAGTHLKSTLGWYNNGNGTNSYGFFALPGGHFISGIFFSLTARGFWWSSTESSSTNAWHRDLYYLNGNVYRHNYHKSNFFSLRCIKD